MLNQGMLLAPLAPDFSGFAPAAFRSMGFALHEDEAIWTREWVCLGVQDDIPDVGDLLPFTVGDHAVHIQRLEGGGLIGRFNKAQHGGCRFVPLQCQQGTKTPCSFTSCGHSRDRRPIKATELGDATPQMYQYLGLRPERLLQVRTASLGPLLFASLDPQGDPVAGIAGELVQRLPELHGWSWPRQGDEWLEFACNWKLAGQYLTGLDAPYERPGMVIGGRTDIAGGGHAHWLFPNLVLLARADSLCAIMLQPTALTRTLCRISIFASAAAADPWLEAIKARGAMAVGAQSSVDGPAGATMPGAGEAVGLWLQTMVMSRLQSRPMRGAAAGLAPFMS